MLSPKTKCLTPRNSSSRSSLDSPAAHSGSGSGPNSVANSNFRNISTISNDLRTGRIGSTSSNSNSTSNYFPTTNDSSRIIISRSPSLSSRRYSFPESQFQGVPLPPASPLTSLSSSSSVNPSNDQSVNLRKMSNEQIIDLMEREQDFIVLKLMKEIENLKEENKNLKNSLSNASTLSSRRASTIPDRDDSYESKKIKRKPSNEIQRKSLTEFNLLEKNQLLQEEVRSLKNIMRKR